MSVTIRDNSLSYHLQNPPCFFFFDGGAVSFDKVGFPTIKQVYYNKGGGRSMTCCGEKYMKERARIVEICVVLYQHRKYAALD